MDVFVLSSYAYNRIKNVLHFVPRSMSASMFRRPKMVTSRDMTSLSCASFISEEKV